MRPPREGAGAIMYNQLFMAKKITNFTNPNPPPTIPFTPAAYQELEETLVKLQAERKAVLQRLQTAREMGDLSENGAYTAAKFEFGNVNRRIRHTTHLLTNGYPVTAAPVAGTASFGSVITLKNERRELTFTLVSEHESNPAEKKLSTTSPIGQAVAGKKIGDSVTVSTPGGEITYTLAAIKV